MRMRSAYPFPHRHLLGIEGLNRLEILHLLDLSEEAIEADAPLDPPIHSTAAAPAAPATPTSWQGILGAGCAGLALGFLIGWRALDRRIRARYGGLKIY